MLEHEQQENVVIKEMESTQSALALNNLSPSTNKVKNSHMEEDRGTWTNQFEFFLSCLGYAVGLGNVWRFPYLCFRNGGGAFLIPYAIMLAFCGLPVFFMELALGQYHAKGANVVFKNIAPLFHGIGYGMMVVSFLVVLYYNMIIAWTLFYTFASFTSELPWEFCGKYWNSPACYQSDQEAKCRENNMTYWNNTCSDVRQFCGRIEHFAYFNTTHCANLTAIVNNATELAVSPSDFSNKSIYSEFAVPVEKAMKRVSPSEEYYLNYVLQISPGFQEFGSPRWQLVLCLILAWIIVGACLIKGVKSSGKVVYFTALFPYVVLVILLIRGATLEGATEGIYFYIIPKWEKLKSAQVWGDAAVQIFYSLGPGFGGLLTLSSYNKFHNNCYRDAITIAICNCGTSVFAGFVIFSILGVMAHSLNVPVEEVVKSGQGLAFIAYPQAVTKMPVSPLWSFLFFFMLITLGLDSQFSMVETLTTGLHDLKPSLTKHKSWIVVITCTICFILGLPFCCEGGVYLFTLVDWYSAGWSIMIIAFFECILLSWIYGSDEFSSNIAEMVGFKPGLYWQLCWKYVTPSLIVGILVFTWATYTPAGYGSYQFPMWANLIGWLIALSSVIMIPLFAIYEIRKARKKGQPLSDTLRPTKEWGPSKQSSLSNGVSLPTLSNGYTYDNFAYSNGHN